VLRWDNVGRSINLAVKAGVVATTPVAPELTRTADMWELGIADVLVARSVVSIVPEAITDTRLNQSLCGLVNSLVMAVYE
jgi:pyridoxine 5'-phosphate synthase PdxJ